MVAVALAVITQSAQLAATTPSSSSPVTMSSPLLPPPSPPQPSDGACSMIDENALSGIIAACGQMQDGVPDRADIITLFSGLWMFKQLAAGCFARSSAANRSDALLARYQPPVGTWRDEGRCGVDAATEEGALQEHVESLDMWYFGTIPGGWDGRSRTQPDDAWIHCACLEVTSPETYRRVIASLEQATAVVVPKLAGITTATAASGATALPAPMDPELMLLRYLLSMELRSILAVVRTGAGTSAARGAASLSAELRGVCDAVPRADMALAAALDRHFMGASCASSARICGYYLIHRALAFTSFFSRPAARADHQALASIAGALQEHVLPFLQAQPQPLSTEAVDLASEVVITFRFIVLPALGHRRADVAALEEAERLIRLARVPAEDCHASVVFAFTRAAR